MTDEGGHYSRLGSDFASHETVQHKADEYVRGDVHTNTVEGYFSIFKRGMKGVYQHCSEKHLHRYVAEFDFRYNARSALGVEDVERTRRALAGIVWQAFDLQGLASPASLELVVMATKDDIDADLTLLSSPADISPRGKVY